MKKVFLLPLILVVLILSGCKDEELNLICDSTLDFEFSGSHTNYRVFDFTVNTVGAFESISWDFGDGQTAQGTDPTHMFTSMGTFTVKCSGLMQCGESFTLEKSVVVSDEFEYRYVVNQIDVSVGSSAANSEDFSASQDLGEEDGLYGSGYLRANSSNDPLAFSINYESTYYINPFVFGLTIYPSAPHTAYGFPAVGVYSNQITPSTALVQVVHTLNLNGFNDMFIGNSLDMGAVSVNVSRSDSLLIGDFTFNIQPTISGSAQRIGSGAFEVQRIRYYYPG
jgi:hypothetical protein